jgi:hypothetical protein
MASGTRLHDVHLGADRDFLQRHRYLHFAGQVWIVELVRVAQVFTWGEVDTFATE